MQFSYPTLFAALGIFFISIMSFFIGRYYHQRRSVKYLVDGFQKSVEQPWVIVDRKNRIIGSGGLFQERYLKETIHRQTVEDLSFKDAVKGLKALIICAVNELTPYSTKTAFDFGLNSSQKLRVKGCYLHRNRLKWILIEELSIHQMAVLSHKDFIANASHELRTPITIIKGFVETLIDMPEISEEILEEVFDKILRSCQRMESTIKNLMILINLDQSSGIKVKTVDILTLFESCFHTLKTLHPRLQYSLQSSKEQINFDVDGDLLELAFMNIMQNAIKYSLGAPEIFVECHSKGTELVVEISDRGIGIPEDKRQKIFERFYTVDKVLTKKLGGVGLGLSIVKSIIEKHKGTIEVRSRDGGGSTFCLTFSSSNGGSVVHRS